MYSFYRFATLMNQVTCPQVVDISKLFNPQSYLTAIKQICCQNQGLELDKLQVFTEVTKKPDAKSIDGPCKDGAYVSGMYLEGARWDQAANSLEDSKPKEMFTAMPVITCKAGISSDLGQSILVWSSEICHSATENQAFHASFEISGSVVDVLWYSRLNTFEKAWRNSCMHACRPVMSDSHPQ